MRYPFPARERTCFVSLLGALLVSLATCSLADEPAILYLFPAGGQRGATLTARVGGLCLGEGAPCEIVGPGVAIDGPLTLSETVWFEGPLLTQPASQQAENYPKDYLARFSIEAATPLGVRYLRVWNSQGATPSLKFEVGDLPETIENEVEGEPLAERVDTPITINGRIFPRQDVDVWSFVALAGETITAETTSARLGYPLLPRLEVYDPSGQRIAANEGAIAGDARLAFVAPRDGVYEVRIQDANNAGQQHYVYRLTLRKGPTVDRTFPLGGKRGETRSFEIAGVGLPPATVSIALPADAPDHFLAQVAVEGGAPLAVPLALDDLPSFGETGANEPPLALPAALDGIISRPGEKDEWRISGTKGAEFLFDVQAARLGSRLDSVITLADEAGAELARVDDLADGQTDSQFRYVFPADGVYRLRIEDRLASRGDPRFAYRVRIAPPPAGDFSLTLASDAVTVLRGGQGKLKLRVQRLAGFAGPVALEFDGLPTGVSMTPAEIPAGAAEVDLTLSADKAAPIDVGRVTIRGSAEIAPGQRETRVARLVDERAASPLETALVAVGLPTPFKAIGTYEFCYVPRGSTLVRRYKIERGGFVGPLDVRLGDRQMRHLQGVTGGLVQVPEGVDEFEYAVYLPPWMELGRTSRTVVTLSGEIVEPDGKKHRVSFTSQNQNEQIVALVSSGPLAVRAAKQALVAKPGASLELSVSVARDRVAHLPVRVELVPPAHARGVTAEPITLASDQTEGTLSIHFDDFAGPFNAPFSIRATTLSDDGAASAPVGQAAAAKAPFVAEAILEIRPAE